MAVMNIRKWDPGHTLRCRFLDGDDFQQGKVKEKAVIWEDYANIKISFGSDPEAEIRISFQADSGSWSAVGTDCLITDYFPQNQPTMNFGWLRDDTPDEEYAHIVVHEFGHALGCIHQYQSPNDNLQWNIDVVYQVFSGPPNYWSKDDIDHNILQRYSPSGISATSFDEHSIMLYQFDGSLFLDGKGTPLNTDLSHMDKQMISQMYPHQTDTSRPTSSLIIADSADHIAQPDVPLFRGAGPESQPVKDPLDRLEPVHFSITSPSTIVSAKPFEIYVWAHLDAQRDEVLHRATQAQGPDLTVKSKGPVGIAAHTLLTVSLVVDSATVEPPDDTLLWQGDIACISFVVTTSVAAPSQLRGCLTVRAEGLEIARLRFLLEQPAAAQENIHRSAFASYASEDLAQVIGRIQALNKVAPWIDVFWDRAHLRSGEYWEKRLFEEIDMRDVFYLFWSRNAQNSAWVNKEWEHAFDAKGVDFIDPFPLETPDLAPPPDKLKAKHFNDPILAFRPRSMKAEPRN
jgi:hypothetical protein